MVGIGLNGHIGFNEPGTSHGLSAHVIELNATTLQVGQKYFSAIAMRLPWLDKDAASLLDHRRLQEATK